MRIKQYLEPDMRSAMRSVREDLGADAVIISTATVENGVEVLAAVDYNPAMAARLQQTLSRQQPQARASRENDALVLQEAASSAAGAASDPVISSMQAELSRLRGLFEEELAEISWQERGHRQPGRLALQNQLQRMGITRELIRDLLDAEPIGTDLNQTLQNILRQLAELIPVYQDDLLDEGGVFALLGPTGVGKTTTVAKLAGRFALRHGRNEVALITTDRFRVGAQEQLYTFGSILSVPVRVATNAADLRKALDSVADRKLVLIDTAGMSQRDMGLTDQLATLASARSEIRSLLVLSAIAQQQVLTETIQAFSHVGLAGSIVTKLDEAASLGPIISTLCRNHLPVAFLGNGQRVPEDMLPARGDALVNEAVRLVRDESGGDSAGERRRG